VLDVKWIRRAPTARLLDPCRPPSKEEASLRAEVEAPFRSLRLVLLGVGVASATLATLFSIPALLGTLLAAPSAKPLAEVLQDGAINVGALATCGLLFRRDYQARARQVSRLMREDQLGGCQVELASGRVVRLAQTRGFARPVVVAGSPQQVREALAAAEPLREQLLQRGVLVVPLPVFGEPGQLAEPLSQPEAGDLRWGLSPSACRLPDLATAAGAPPAPVPAAGVHAHA
jgi:hypothetical protein